MKKILKKIFYFLFILAVCYFSYYVFTNRADLEVRMQVLQDKLIPKPPVEEVSPIITPTLTIPAPEGMEQQPRNAFCYYKERNADLYLYLSDTMTYYQSLLLRDANGAETPIPNEFLTFLESELTLIVSTEFFTDISPGEYQIIGSFEDRAWYYPLLVEDNVTFNSSHVGVINRGNRLGYQELLKSAPRDITYYVSNIGDNEIRSVFVPEPGIKQESISISPNGDRFTISPDYFLNYNDYTCFTVKYTLANGDQPELLYIVVSENPINHPDLTGSSSYQAGDGSFAITYTLNEASKAIGASLDYVSYEGNYSEIALPSYELLQEGSSGSLTLSEDFMKTLSPGYYSLFLKYSFETGYKTSKAHNFEVL